MIDAVELGLRREIEANKLAIAKLEAALAARNGLVKRRLVKTLNLIVFEEPASIAKGTD